MGIAYATEKPNGEVLLFQERADSLQDTVNNVTDGQRLCSIAEAAMLVITPNNGLDYVLTQTGLTISRDNQGKIQWHAGELTGPQSCYLLEPYQEHRSQIPYNPFGEEARGPKELKMEIEKIDLNSRCPELLKTLMGNDEVTALKNYLKSIGAKSVNINIDPDSILGVRTLPTGRYAVEPVVVKFIDSQRVSINVGLRKEHHKNVTTVSYVRTVCKQE